MAKERIPALNANTQNSAKASLDNVLEGCLKLSQDKEDDEIELTKSERFKAFLYRRWRLSKAFVKKHGIKIALILGIAAACAGVGYFYLSPHVFEAAAATFKSLIPNIGWMANDSWWTTEGMVHFVNAKLIAPLLEFKEGITGCKLAATALGSMVTKTLTTLSGITGLFLGDKLVRSASTEWQYQKNTERFRGFGENDFDRQWIYQRRMVQQMAPMVKALDQNPDVLHMKDSQGNTILDYAIEAQDVALIKKLKKMGVDFDSANKNGMTPRRRLKKIVRDRHLVKAILPPKKEAKKRISGHLLSFLRRKDVQKEQPVPANETTHIKKQARSRSDHLHLRSL